MQVYTYTVGKLTVCAADPRQAHHSCRRLIRLQVANERHAISGMQVPGDMPSLSFAVPVAAGVAGVVLSFVLSPFELVKV